MNGSGYRIGGRKQGGFATVAAAAAMALAVNSAFVVVLMSGTTAGQRSYRSIGKDSGAMVASVSETQRKACQKI